MRLPWRHDRIRRCVLCGDEWRVPYALRRPYRPGKWRVGVSAADHRGGPGGASVHYNLENARFRADQAEAQMALTESFQRCPNCESEEWVERRA